MCSQFLIEKLRFKPSKLPTKALRLHRILSRPLLADSGGARLTNSSALYLTGMLFSPSLLSDPLPPHERPYAARQASLYFTIFHSWLKLMSTESVRPSNHLILCIPLFFLPSIFLSIRVFSNESVLRIRWPKYWSFKLQRQSFQ